MSISQVSLIQCKNRKQLAILLGVDTQALNYYAYSSRKKYHQFLIPKKSGGNRIITAPVGSLNHIQKTLAGFLNELYVVHPAAHGFINNKSIVSNATLHVQKRCILNIDLEDFFPSITTTRIIGLLKSKHFGLENEVASAIAGICTYDGRVPQGAATSPVISNMICYRLDRELSALCKSERVSYSRYADDISFSTTSSKFSSVFIEDYINGEIELGNKIKAIVESNYFAINHSKTRLHRGKKPKYVTGVKVNTKPNVNRKYVRHIRCMLNAWEVYGLEAAQKEFEEKYNGRGRNFDQVVLGKIAHLKQIKGKDDLVFRRLHNKAFTLAGCYDKLLPESDIEELSNKIFVVKSGSKYGTGFILDEKWLITSAHTVVANEVKFFNHTRSAVPIDYLTTHKKEDWYSPKNDYDIAALPIKNEIIQKDNVLKLASSTESVVVGDAYRIVGFPNYFLGATPAMMDVKVIQITKNSHGVYDAYVDGNLVQGNSGGPVLNSRNEVVGVVRTGTVSQQNPQGLGSTFLPIQELRKCLEEFAAKK